MESAFLAVLLLVVTLLLLDQHKIQQGRATTPIDEPREHLLPRHYKSFVEVENKLWAATEETMRSAGWDRTNIKLQPAELRIVQNYVAGLRKDFSQGNRIFSAVIARAPDAKSLKLLESQRMRIEFSYYVASASVRLRLWTNRISLRELRQLTQAVATLAYEVRWIVRTLEEQGHLDFVESVLRH